MAVNPRQIQFRSYEDLAAHLNTWAARQLVTPEDWAAAVVSSRDWLDYSGRNQVLLASYGVDGPVAGVETWRLVPSTTAGRPCAVRAGEHGWPVRVPVTTSSHEPDPYLGGKRPTRSAVDRFEWRPVFSIDQLARRPAPGSLAPVESPVALTGPLVEETWLKATRQVARSTIRGRMPKTSDPGRLLADAAGRVARRSDRPELDSDLRDQVAWLVADRVGLASGTMPSFDPEPIQPRGRWPMLQDVLDSTRKLTGALGVALGVNLTASALPRMEIVDDRAVPAGSRRRLPAASFEQLPVGSWMTVGPYTPDEWASRGENGAGQGAYFRLNGSAYLVAIENGEGAAWRLEDLAERTGHGLLAQGDTRSLDEARADAVAAMHDRYPALQPLAPSTTTGSSETPPPETTAATAWRPVPGEGKTKAQQRRLSPRVVVFAFPGPGGQWLPAVQDGTSLTHLAYAPNAERARAAAELAGTKAVRITKLDSPAELDRFVASLCAGGDYSRADLVALVENRLMPVDRRRLDGTDLTQRDLAELLGSAGITPATTIAVLRAEGTRAGDVAELLPIVGVPMEHGIRVLNELWDLPRPEAAELLGATAHEMRAAGCTPTEILGTRPREILRALPADPHTWELAAATMAVAGHSTGRVVSHLIAHAPTPDTFAAGLAAAAADAHEGFTTAIGFGAQGEQLAAASERYGLSPEQTATLLADAGAAKYVAVETLHQRCAEHPVMTAELAEAALGLAANEVREVLESLPSRVVPISDRHEGGRDQRPHTAEQVATDVVAPNAQGTWLDRQLQDDLLSLLPDPVDTVPSDPAALIDLIPEPQPVDLGSPLDGAP